jgi:hypothetical protein
MPKHRRNVALRGPALLRKLEGGDRRSIGRSNEVVADLIAAPGLFGAVFSGLRSGDPVVRARAADAIEKFTRGHPQCLLPYRKELIDPLARLDQKEVRWHVAQMLPRIPWNKAERRRVLNILIEYLTDPSSIVKTFAMQALADFARRSPELRPAVLLHLRESTATGTPAMKARGRRLLGELERDGGASAPNSAGPQAGLCASFPRR